KAAREQIYVRYDFVKLPAGRHGRQFANLTVEISDRLPDCEIRAERPAIPTVELHFIRKGAMIWQHQSSILRTRTSPEGMRLLCCVSIMAAWGRAGRKLSGWRPTQKTPAARTS